jgi:hypothetical protein
MPDQSFYDSIPENHRREIAFHIVASIREATNVALKQGTPPTYEAALRITHDIDPKLYEFCSRELQNKNDNDIARLFKDKATAASLGKGKEVTAVELLEAEIDEHRNLANQRDLPKAKQKSILKYICSLEAALENMRPRRLMESAILERDFRLIDRSYLGAENMMQGDSFVDYVLPNNRRLRIRMLHPDRGEQVLGADLLYEKYNMFDETVRIALLQYKVWPDQGVMTYGGNDNRDLAQMNRLYNQTCNNNLCLKPNALDGHHDYRFPYCCAFLRPTDRIQESDSKMFSTGIHIPICSALQMANQDKRIVKSEIRHTAVTHNVFEHLFNHGFLGSRSLNREEIENFYRDLTITTGIRPIVLYAKEITLDPAKIKFQEFDDDQPGI